MTPSSLRLPLTAALLFGALWSAAPLTAHAQTADSAAAARPPLSTPKARPVRAGIDDSTYARRYKQGRYLRDAIQHNRPISWIAPLGEQSTPHKSGGLSPDRHPDYVFTSYVTTSFIVVGQPRWAFTIDPGFLLRMRYGGDTRGSYPVRTPSYHASGNFYFLTRIRATPPPVDYGPNKPIAPPDDDVHYQYLRLGLRHHSNGQQGNALINGRPNELDGNFVNNAIEADYAFGARTTRAAWAITPYASYGLRQLADPTQDGRYLFRRTGIRLTREVFSSWRRVIGKPAQADEESTVQLARRNKSRVYTELNINVGLSRLDSLPTAEQKFYRRVNAEGTVVFIPRFMHQTGLFVTVGYYGEDPYNINYFNRYAFVRAGIATAAFRNVTELLR